MEYCMLTELNHEMLVQMGVAKAGHRIKILWAVFGQPSPKKVTKLLESKVPGLCFNSFPKKN